MTFINKPRTLSTPKEKEEEEEEEEEEGADMQITLREELGSILLEVKGRLALGSA